MVIEIEMLRAKLDQLVLDNKELHETIEDSKMVIEEMARVIKEQKEENGLLREQTRKAEAQLLGNSEKLSKEHMTTTSSFQNPSTDYSSLKQASDSKLQKCVSLVGEMVTEYEEHFSAYEVSTLQTT